MQGHAPAAPEAATTAGDASLQALETSVGPIHPGLYGARSRFVAQARSDQAAATITATPTDPAAEVHLNGAALPGGVSAPMPLSAGRNTLRLRVAAADRRATRDYELNILRAYPTPNWVRHVEAAPFAPRDSAGELVFDGRMWLFGGYLPELVSDAWASRDGLTWDRVGTIPDPSGINIPVQFAHAGRMWVVTQAGRLFASADGAAWEMVHERPAWAPRYAAAGAVFRGRMWVAGGMRDGELFHDLWSSADGVEWTREVPEAPWSRRQLFGNLVVHRDRLFLVGGGVTVYQPFRAYRDVWSSEDGRAWTRVAEQAPWPARVWSCCVSYRDRLWLLGGYRAQPTAHNFNDVWHSADGERWERLETEDLWSPRHELSGYVFDGRLWVVAGNAWPLVNDVWSLQIDGLTFVSQPVVEEFVGAEHRYEARAEFHRGGGPLRYRLAAGPAWLRVDKGTGVVGGVPPALGDYPVELEASSDAGETARQAYTLHVIPVG